MIKMKKSEKLVIIFFAIIAFAALGLSVRLITEPKPLYNIVLGADELNDGIKADRTILIDLRDEADYEEGHIDGAINMPYTDDGKKMLDYLNKQADKNYTLYLMCYSGNRAGMAFNLLKDKGYRSLNYVRFGYEDYVNKMGNKFKPVQGECPCKNYD